MTKKILAFAGSTRKVSWNKHFVAVAAKMAEAQGAEVTLVDLADYPAPIFDGDYEDANGMPEPMRRLRKMVMEADGLIIASPEYNGHVTPVLVNTFSWISRSDGEDKAKAFAGKKAAVMAASIGGNGGIRVIPRLRDMLAELGVMVVPGFATLRNAASAFDESGALTDEGSAKTLEGLVQRLVEEA